MKVLHVTATGRRRGGEVFASDLTRQLKKEGVEQEVIVLRASSIDVDFGVPVIRVTSPDRRRPIRPRALAAVARRAGEWRPDVIQAHGGEALKHAVVAGRSAGARLVYRRIGSSETMLASSGLRRRAYARMMARADRVVTVADALRTETIEGFGLRHDRVVTIPNAVDPERVRPRTAAADVRAALGIALDQVVLLTLGSFTWEKDPLAHVAIGAAAMAATDRVVHVFAGDGPMRVEAERRAASLGIAARCRFLGQRQAVGDLLGASDVLLLASRPGTEGMPAAVIEAAMLGVPVVTFDVAGVSEVVVDGVTGYVVPQRSMDSFGRCLLRVIDDRALAARMGAAARERSCRFEIGAVGRQYLDLYGSLVA